MLEFREIFAIYKIMHYQVGRSEAEYDGIKKTKKKR